MNFINNDNLFNIKYSKKSLLNEIASLFSDNKSFTSLFTVENGNPKTEKGNKLKVNSQILHMSPHKESKNLFNENLNNWYQLKDNEINNIKDNYLDNIDYESTLNNIYEKIDLLESYSKLSFNFCAMASAECIENCLFKSGNPIYNLNDRKTISRSKKNIAFIVLHRVFMKLLKIEIDSKIKSFINNSKYKDYDYLAFRLNGTQDVKWESKYIDEFKTESVLEYIERQALENNIKIVCYDYTKYTSRHLKENFPKNYHLTFSYDSNNLDSCESALKSGLNVAIPFINGLPKLFKIGNKHYKVFNGDLSDCRFLDPKNVIVGLKFKFDTTKNCLSRLDQKLQAVKSGFAIDTLNDTRCIGVQ